MAVDFRNGTRRRRLQTFGHVRRPNGHVCGAGKGVCRGVGRNICRGADGACGAPPLALLAPGPPSFFHGFSTFALRSMHTRTRLRTQTRANTRAPVPPSPPGPPPPFTTTPRHRNFALNRNLTWSVRGTGSARRERMRESQRAHAKQSEPEQVRAPKRGLSREREHDIESAIESKPKGSCER